MQYLSRIEYHPTLPIQRWFAQLVYIYCFEKSYDKIHFSTLKTHIKDLKIPTKKNEHFKQNREH